jgi:Cys-rich protein (TIGR01571 family)
MTQAEHVRVSSPSDEPQSSLEEIGNVGNLESGTLAGYVKVESEYDNLDEADLPAAASLKGCIDESGGGRMKTISIDENDVITLTATNAQCTDSNGNQHITNNFWKDHFFVGLFNNIFPSCCCAFVCPCLLLSQMGDALKWNPFVSTFSMFLLLGAVLLVLLVVCQIDALIIFWLYLFYVSWNVRDRIRTALNIQGSAFTDCLGSFFCPCCATAHSARTFYDYEGVVSCDFGMCSLDGMPPRWRDSHSPSVVSSSLSSPALPIVLQASTHGRGGSSSSSPGVIITPNTPIRGVTITPSSSGSRLLVVQGQPLNRVHAEL